jgi:hypothetical protein
MYPRGADDFQGALSGCLRQRDRSKNGACADKKCRNNARGSLACRYKVTKNRNQ